MPIPILTYRDVCAICGKTPRVALNRPHSQHKTKRLIRPNLLRWEGLYICAACRKALDKPDRVGQIRRPAQPLTPTKLVTVAQSAITASQSAVATTS